MSDPAPTFDLQSHSICSDGSLPPAGVVRAAAAAGVELLALTDHDTVDGIREAARATADAGIRLVTGVEISARTAHDEHEVHILGYLIDDTDARLRAWLATSRAGRERRAAEVVEALRELGWAVDDEALRARRAADLSIGRPHLAEAAFTAPANHDRLRAEGITDVSGFLEAYLVPGAPAYRTRRVPSSTDAISAIDAAGGVAVWAHPFWDYDRPEAVIAAIDAMRADGLDGVECFYPSHTREQAGLLADRCDSLGLLSTGSADFHGPERRNFSRFRAFSTYGREPRLGPLLEP